MRSFSSSLLATALSFSLLLFAGCDLTDPTSDRSEVEIGFKTTSSSSTNSADLTTKATSDSLVLTGSNGTLRVTDVRLIVSEIELDGEADSAEFEMERPMLLDLPLDTADVAPVAADLIPPGSYTELEFEVENVGLDEDDDEEELQGLRDQIQSEGFSNWPEAASMVAEGTFTPEDDSARSFRAYFDADIEVEREMDRSFDIGGDGLSRRLTVKLDPALWFAGSDGTVMNLTQFDYQSTGELVEFEAEFEEGITEIEFDD